MKSSKVMIYTENFLPFSESFIVRQTSNFRNWEIGYICRRISDLRLSNLIQCEEITEKKTISKFLFTIFGFSANLRNICSANNAVIVHHANNSWRVWKSAKNTNCKILVICHGSDVFRKPRLCLGYSNWQFNRNIYRIGVRVDLFIAISHAVKHQLILKGINEDKIIVSYIGTECQELTNNPKDFDLIFIGRLEENKGPQLLLEALSRIKLNLKVIIIGSGSLESDLKKSAKSIIGAEVTFTGPVDHQKVKEFMRKSKLCVIPSIQVSTGESEGLSMVAVEALSVGLPILISNCGGLPETIKNGGGILFDNGNIDSLVKEISNLIIDEEKLLDLGFQGFQSQRKYFCIEKNTFALQRAIEDFVLAK